MTTIKVVFSTLFVVAIGYGSVLANDKSTIGTPKELRILCYNIHIGIGNDKKLDLERTAKTIMAQKPDLVAIQEIDRLTTRTQNVDQVAELKRLTGMHAVFGKTISLGSGEYGIAILSKYPITEHKVTQLPQMDNQEDRGVLEATIQLDKETTLLFVCTHLCHVNEERRTKQAEKINELFAQRDGLVILAGDINARPGSKTVETLKAIWSDATNEEPTFPSDNPRSKIDYIFYRPAEMVCLKETRVIEEPVTSDHAPVLAVLEIVKSGK